MKWGGWLFIVYIDIVIENGNVPYIFNYNNKSTLSTLFSIKSNPKNARVFSLGVYITHKHKTNYKLLWEAG